MPNGNMPTAEEMAKQMNNAQPNPVVIKPQAQPVAQTQTQAKPNIELANTPENTESTESATDQVNSLLPLIKRWFTKLVGIGLTLQGLYGIYKSVVFILVEYPVLEQMLVEHQITQVTVNELAIKAILIAISTIFSMFFALRLTILQSTVAKRLNTVIGILLFLGNALLHDYFIQFNTSQYMVDAVLSIVYFFNGAPEKVFEDTPLIEETLESGFKAVWYK